VARRRILIVGAGGMLATDVEKLIRQYPKRYNLAALTEFDLDITREASVARALKELKPHVTINCAAYTAVDDCEVKQDLAYLVNAAGAEILAKACARAKSKLVHISTDFVFDGRKKTPYRETDLPKPRSIYGKSKLEGENRVRKNCKDCLIVRTSWLYGAGGNNFVKTVLGLARSRNLVRVVEDQRGCPTNTPELSKAILVLIDRGKKGIYHACGEGVCSWYEFALEIVRLSGLSAKVHPIKTRDYRLPARRPKYSALSTAKLRRATGFRFKPWQEALENFFSENKLAAS